MFCNDTYIPAMIVVNREGNGAETKLTAERTKEELSGNISDLMVSRSAQHKVSYHITDRCQKTTN